MKFRDLDDKRYLIPDFQRILKEMVGTNFVVCYGVGFNSDGSGGMLAFVNAEAICYQCSATCTTAFVPDKVEIHRADSPNEDEWLRDCCYRALQLDDWDLAMERQKVIENE